MRDRLIEMIQNAVGGCARNWAEVIADHLLASWFCKPTCMFAWDKYHKRKYTTMK